MAVPDFQTLMLPVLAATANGEIPASDLRDRVAASMKLSDEDLKEMLPSGRQTTFANRTAWANVFLQRAGLIQKTSRGVYCATPAGLEVIAQHPQKIDIKFLERFPSYVEWRQRSTAGSLVKPGEPIDIISSVQASDTPEEQIERSYRVLTSALEADLLDRVRGMSPGFFETLILRLLGKLGYGGGEPARGQVTGGPGDGGIDGVINEDSLGLDRIYLQAKRYGANNTVGRPEVQAFSGSLDGVSATKGILITTGSISPGAREYASRIAKRIILIDGAELARLMVEHEVGVQATGTYTIRKIDENYFVE
jgi:restriction system protein